MPEAADNGFLEATRHRWDSFKEEYPVGYIVSIRRWEPSLVGNPPRVLGWRLLYSMAGLVPWHPRDGLREGMGEGRTCDSHGKADGQAMFEFNCQCVTRFESLLHNCMWLVSGENHTKRASTNLSERRFHLVLDIGVVRWKEGIGC